MTIWSSGYRVKNIKPLDSEKALKDGAEFVGEGFIFVVSFGLLLWEYNRTQEANKAKQETKRQQIKAEQAVLKAKLHALDIRLKAVEDVIKEQTDSLLGLSKGKYKQPPPQELVPIDDDDDDDSNGSEMEANKENGKKSEGSDSAEERDTAPTESRLWWRFW
ncbi:optic atrophy 3 OPA3 domain containing protein [Nitzschia inconspicua]|uniref:Optic atrophy 3 OPA3 domain containing protein n=1 Tax=Nitzschia inconspicua TaxID=303405 RepID=A0A9K3L9D8_9STRA|nr:optic atrophy 3 OPA3 domain containing protein [Nitzschia inconspicua]KAG7358057.1 optic atrophy 3 OPA3 domain containing protein [Nitzschia inconspicua]